MKISSGGKGNPAPYSTTHVRVPVPIKHQVELQIAEFKRRVENKEIVLSGGDVYIQLPFHHSWDYESTLDLLNYYADNHSSVEDSSPRNASLRNFRRWLEREIKNRR